MSTDVLVSADGFVQFLTEMCGVDSTTVQTVFEAVHRCVDSGVVHIALAILQFIAGNRMGKRPNFLLVPRGEISKIKSACVVSADAILSDEALSRRLAALGYPEPYRTEVQLVEEIGPEVRSERRVVEQPVQALMAVVFTTVDGHSYPFLMYYSGSLTVENPPADIQSKLVELCEKMHQQRR